MIHTANLVSAAIVENVDFEDWTEIEDAADGTVVLHITFDGSKTEHPVTKVASFGIQREEGELWVVVRVGHQYFKQTGYWSWDEPVWDGELCEVRPVEKNIIAYEKLGE